jgi:hypothetical protein
METTITGIVYLDMIQQFLIPQTKMAKSDAFTSSKTAHPLITLEKCAITSAPISQVGGFVEKPMEWPPSSKDLTPLDFFFWRFLKDRDFVPPLAANAVELRTRIVAAVAEVKPEMLRSVWQEIDYR